MILLVVTGLAFGAQYVTPVETAANCQKTAQAFAARCKTVYCCSAGAEFIAYSRTTEFKPCPAAITEKDFFEESEEMRDPLVMEEFIDQWRYRMGTLK